MPGTTIDLSNPGTKVKPPISLAHVVLRTANYEPMVSFWTSFLGAHVTFGNAMITFLRYDDEHHRIAIVNMPHLAPKNPLTAGLEHIAFSYATLDDLVLTYRQRKALGIAPSWCINHGPTTSIYYSDPDGNRIETQVDNFDTVDEADEFMTGKYFAENPVGTDFDPEELARRLQAGEDHGSIKKRVEVGPRGIPEHF